MSYSVWKDAEGQYHIISEMKKSHIKNCINQINIAIQSYDVKSNEGREEYIDEKFPVLHKEWSKKYANGFLDSFNTELEIRQRIKERDYPAVSLNRECDTCNRVYCEKSFNNGECDSWLPSVVVVIDCLSGVDAQVAQRAGFICNDEVYKY